MLTNQIVLHKLIACTISMTIALVGSTAIAQQPSIEQQRHFAQFRQQYDLVQAMKARAAWQAGTPIYGAPTPYVPQAAFHDPWLQGYTSPFLRRGIWGYGFYDGARQSIGQHQVQTAPDRWESYPVYPEDLQPQPGLAPPPTFTPPQHFGPSASPAPEPAVRGVRGF